MAIKLGVEKVFWDDGASERSLGMIEARYDLDLWCKSLEPFTTIDIEVNRKMLSEIAIADAAGFDALVAQAKAALA